MSHFPNRSLNSELTQTLRDAIISGEIAQGSRLSETRLAKEFNVSRGPLREAIRRLEGMNLVHHRPQLGVRVVSLDTEFMLQLYDAREALESKAAALAAEQMNSMQIEQLNRLLDVQSRQMRDDQNAQIPAESDYAFHEFVIKASNNTVIIHALLEEIYHLIRMFRYQSDTSAYGSTNALSEHRQIAYAIEQRDPVLAEVTMRQHVARAKQRIQQRLSEQAANHRGE